MSLIFKLGVIPKMNLGDAFRESEKLAGELLQLIDLPLCNGTARVGIADVACSLSLEHWHSVRRLLADGLMSSALVVHRSQFEAILRSVWLTYAASEADVAKLATVLDLETEQAAKNLSQAQQMMAALAKSGPKEAHAALARFKDNSWKALNSYAHAGIHPLRRHADGYPVELVFGVLRNSNGLGVLSGMQAVVLSGAQPLQRQVLALAARHSACMPPPL